MRLNVTRTVYVNDTITLPRWMIFAMNGEKINAIKALRECAGKGGTDQTMVGLSHAKCIVESIMDNVITENGESRIINITAS